MRVKISHIEPETRLLGPYPRFCVWVHGCSRGCNGCIAKDMDSRAPIETDTSALAEAFLSTGCEGLTISGGEPFEQAPALTALIDEIRRSRDAGVIIYTGYYMEELEDGGQKSELLKRADLIIDGPYIAGLNDGRAYIGSSNQRLHYLTQRYKRTEYYSAKTRRCRIKIGAGGAALIGVPSKDALDAWNSLKGILKVEPNG